METYPTRDLPHYIINTILKNFYSVDFEFFVLMVSDIQMHGGVLVHANVPQREEFFCVEGELDLFATDGQWRATACRKMDKVAINPEVNTVSDPDG